MGLPNLSPWQQKKVDSANTIYKVVAAIMRKCHEFDIPFTVENPTNSYMWDTVDIREAMEDLQTFNVDLHACMFGSDRNKKTRLVTNKREFLELAITCDGSHEHRPWGRVWERGTWKWATKLECEYPKQLCDAIAGVATKIVCKAPLPTPAPKAVRKVPTRSAQLAEVRADAGKQTRHRHPVNVPERHPSQWVVASATTHPRHLVPGAVKDDIVVGDLTIPKGSFIHKVTQNHRWEDTGSDQFTFDIQYDKAWTTEEFMKESAKIALPWRRQPSIPDKSLRNIVQALEMGVEGFNSKWNKNIEILLSRVGRFKAVEREARKELRPYVQRVSGSKRTKFMEQLLRETD